MPQLIEILREDHRNIARVLGALERQVQLLEDDANPDLNLLQAIAGYFCDYPDRCHHPKEEAILRHLQDTYPLAASRVADLSREHRDAHARAGRFRDNIQVIFRDEILPRERVVRSARTFLEGERNHMMMEEARFFPVALETLNEDDWKSIESGLPAARDPLFGQAAEDEFKALRETLLEWEQSR